MSSFLAGQPAYPRKWLNESSLYCLQYLTLILTRQPTSLQQSLLVSKLQPPTNEDQIIICLFNYLLDLSTIFL